jgi:methionyl-tRNA formyltransferase
MFSAVVFAYHNVGVRCLATLAAHGVNIPLVVTHGDDPGENLWFASVREFADSRDIPCIAPRDPNDPAVIARIRSLAPDFLFSFYYRAMLKPALLEIPRSAALNMHGSLLPKYRGRAPVNWAIIRGESETGATLHYMVEKPDAGAIVGQAAVPILPDDSALDVFNKVTVAAELVLNRTLPALLNGLTKPIAQDLSQGHYFGARTPEDGRIDWHASAQDIHNLVRGVAPPYPGAFTLLDGKRLRVLCTRIEPSRAPRSAQPGCYLDAGRLHADCGDGKVLRIVTAELDGELLDADRFSRLFGLQSAPSKFCFDP